MDKDNPLLHIPTCQVQDLEPHFIPQHVNTVVLMYSAQVEVQERKICDYLYPLGRQKTDIP